jgi:hypothetical protein
VAEKEASRNTTLAFASMDYHQLIAELLWTGFAICVIGIFAGVQLAWRGHRNAALGLLLACALGTSAFSLVAGFSVGRFTALIPALVTGYMFGMGRGWPIVTAGLVVALATYVSFSWMLTDLMFQGGIFSLVFGAWAIPTYAIAALAAYAVSVTHPPAWRAMRRQ